MKKIFSGFIAMIIFTLSAPAQIQNIKEKLSEFFFDAHFNIDIEALRIELKNNPDFKFYQDPNRDPQKTIVGTIGKNKNLNPLCTDNQIIIQYSTAEAKKKKEVSLKWSMSYTLADLSSALVDFEKLKSEFRPFFSDSVELKKTGAQKEKISSLILKEKSMTVTVTLVEYINFSHTLSLEYRDKWKIAKGVVLEVKH